MAIHNTINRKLNRMRVFFGVATSLISVPTRYMHTPVEMFHLHDVECTVKLIAETIMTLTADSDFVL